MAHDDLDTRLLARALGAAAARLRWEAGVLVAALGEVAEGRAFLPRPGDCRIGARTRQPDGAQIEFFFGVPNPRRKATAS